MKASMKAFMRYSESLTASPFHHAEPNVPLTLRETRLQVQNMIKHDTSLIVETGDRYLVLHPDMSAACCRLSSDSLLTVGNIT